MSDEPRPFYVHLRDNSLRGMTVDEAASPLEAAVMFAELWHGEPEGEELDVLAIDCESGARVCFHIVVGEDQAVPC